MLARKRNDGLGISERPGPAPMVIPVDIDIGTRDPKNPNSWLYLVVRRCCSSEC